MIFLNCLKLLLPRANAGHAKMKKHFPCEKLFFKVCACAGAAGKTKKRIQKTAAVRTSAPCTKGVRPSSRPPRLEILVFKRAPDTTANGIFRRWWAAR